MCVCGGGGQHSSLLIRRAAASAHPSSCVRAHAALLHLLHYKLVQCTIVNCAATRRSSRDPERMPRGAASGGPDAGPTRRGGGPHAPTRRSGGPERRSGGPEQRQRQRRQQSGSGSGGSGSGSSRRLGKKYPKSRNIQISQFSLNPCEFHKK